MKRITTFKMDEDVFKHLLNLIRGVWEEMNIPLKPVVEPRRYNRYKMICPESVYGTTREEGKFKLRQLLAWVYEDIQIFFDKQTGYNQRILIDEYNLEVAGEQGETR